MMTPKEKAQELYNKFYNTSSHQHHVESRKDNAKQCALMLVDEMIKVFNPENWGLEIYNAFEGLKYWKEVKQEIELL
jgi:hypothetical protein